MAGGAEELGRDRNYVKGEGLNGSYPPPSYYERESTSILNEQLDYAVALI